MSEVKFTKGPWEFDRNNSHSGQIAILHGCSEGWIELWSPVWPNEENQEANARLIAAAPELYEATNNLLFLCRKYIPGHHWLPKAEEALKKARGEA